MYTLNLPRSLWYNRLNSSTVRAVLFYKYVLHSIRQIHSSSPVVTDSTTCTALLLLVLYYTVYSIIVSPDRLGAGRCEGKFPQEVVRGVFFLSHNLQSDCYLERLPSAKAFPLQTLSLFVSPLGNRWFVCTRKRWAFSTRQHCMVTHIARVWINRVRLPVLHVVS